ncbi:MAG: transcription-repair coupling factor [Actinobacteria bacterium]|nr:transcription-repair coupling factor [Actinomycetota bacterium]
MSDLTSFLARTPDFKALLERASSEPAAVEAPSFVHEYVAATVLAAPAWRGDTCLVVTGGQDLAEEAARELSLHLPRHRVLLLPSRGVWYGSEGVVPPRVVGNRSLALGALAGPTVVVAEAATLMERALPPVAPPLVMKVGEHTRFDDLAGALVDLGYQRVDQVEDPGEFSVRGGLVDIFPTTESAPVRVEFWGDDVESIRSFSVYSQRSLASLDEVRVVAAEEDATAESRPVHELLPAKARVLLLDPARIEGRVEAFVADLDDVAGNGAGTASGCGEYGGRRARDCYLTWEEVRAALETHLPLTIRRRGDAGRESAPEGAAALTIRATSGEMPIASLPDAEKALERLAGEGFRVVVAFESRAEAERATFILKRASGRQAAAGQIPGDPGISYLGVPHRRHFVLPDAHLALLTDTLLFPRRRKATGPKRLSVGAALSSFRDLRKGDFVVHEDHGVGRFEGISTKTVAGVTRDYLDLVFRDSDMLYLPHDQIGKVGRYVGADATPPTLSKLGGKAWSHLKTRARAAVREMAAELLRLYALRQTTPGHEFPEDGDWQRRFEVAFPHVETIDQRRTIDEVKDDMERPQPMDRLICGDVGYGKTEVALRAAFKAAMDSKQVLVLVPTTILAQQHYGTFRERMGEFPVRVEMVSRFRSPKEQRRILNEFKTGSVDVLIGTHRLLSADVQPKDLGLVIVDEEQRFGVAQKEALRTIKLKVDALTLSATPIPRTLHMSLSGVRDISVIETPPRDRHPIQTYVGIYDEQMVRRAVEREVGRGGQVFYLHNRVDTIERAAGRLAELMPQVRFGVAHGQMPEAALERVMLDFLRGDYDVLVSTTIIESGLDIPNANTLVVERADLLGLSQLYQIRGRIGRSARVAHAFLFHPDEEALTEEARARLSTLADYTELGSGFKIAMRDLEIRGAGDLLGGEQSGHVAAVGFELYLSMLQETVDALEGRETRAATAPRIDVGVDAYVPSSYIPYEAAKVDLHRRIAITEGREALAELREELGDRFGDVPEPVDNLIFLGEVRDTLQKLGVFTLSVRRHKLTMTGLSLPPGGRERLLARDRRYVYSPTRGELSLGLRSDARSVREAVEGVLGDILPIWSGAASEAT